MKDNQINNNQNDNSINNIKEYRYLNFIRVIACIAVLLYHLNILKGGYLAVCTFFTLSGYLSCISAIKKEKFSLLEYYRRLFFKLYLPLIIVIFSTISLISIFPNINWLNLKPETTSILLGYNNYWQLHANLDYFTRHIDSPFIHLWYISILLQFDLLFPFLYLLLKKLGDKFHKIIPCIISIILSIISTIYFYKLSLNENIMISYYDTFSRIFSLLFGVSLGFIHFYYHKLVVSKLQSNLLSKLIFTIYLIILIILFIFIDAKSIYFAISMIITTIITCRLIAYGAIDTSNKKSILNSLTKFLSNISYEIYLLQYPIIFLFQFVTINNYLKIIITIILIISLSYLLHFAIKNNNPKVKILKKIILIFIIIFSIYGIYNYLITEDHTEEMKELENQLSNNEKMSKEKQESYIAQQKEKDNAWNLTLENLEAGEKELQNVVTNLPVVGIGDSIMLGALENLYKQFPNSYFDAQTSRTAWEANNILQGLKNKNILGNPIIINLGANGDCSKSCKEEIIETLEDRKIFWVNVTNDSEVHVNEQLLLLANSHDNIYIIDWNSISNNHPEYFIADKIHLTQIGREVYTKAIYDSIYDVYLKEYQQKKDEIIKQHEESLKKEISFYGNDLLLNAFDYIQTEFPNAKYIINKDTNYASLKNQLETDYKNNNLNYKIVLAFDNTLNITTNQYEELIKLYPNNQIYIISTTRQSSNNLLSINYNNVNIINFYQEITSSPEYLMNDKIHLTEEGNRKLTQILTDTIR